MKIKDKFNKWLFKILPGKKVEPEELAFEYKVSLDVDTLLEDIRKCIINATSITSNKNPEFVEYQEWEICQRIQCLKFKANNCNDYKCPLHRPKILRLLKENGYKITRARS